MVKKKQQDFQKTKLRVGRRLPRGQNVTSTSFKAKRITVPSQLDRKKISRSIPLIKDLLISADRNLRNPASKAGVLSQIHESLVKQKDTLNTNLADILGKVIQDIKSEEKDVRNAAIKVLTICLESTSDAQIDCFFTLLTCNLNCAMTDISLGVRRDSLILLGVMLKTHPDLICHSIPVFNNLIDMIALRSPKTGKRELHDNVNDIITSQEWRIQVLSLLKTFLEAFLSSSNKKTEDEVNNDEILWDGKKPLYLSLYAGGGLKPLQPVYTWHWNSNLSSDKNDFWNMEICKNIIYDLIPILSNVFAGEIPKFSSITKNCDLAPEIIKHLYVVLQLFCCLGEWLKFISKSENDAIIWFADHCQRHICTIIMKGFPYSEHSITWIKNKHEKKVDQVKSLQLNLTICDLYTSFVLPTRYSLEDSQECILSYLKHVFKMNYDGRVNSISLLVKISRNYLENKSTGLDTVEAILIGMCSILETLKPSPSYTLLFSFFVELSLNPDFDMLIGTNGMHIFFGLLFKEIKNMRVSKKVDKNLLRDVKKICSRQYDQFLVYLHNIEHAEWLDLLTYKDEDFQDTIIRMLMCCNSLSSDLLQDIAELILLTSTFSLKTVTRLIRNLQLRFSGANVSAFDKHSFFKFLLNIACDTVNICDEKWAGHQVQEFDRFWAAVQSLSDFEIYPSAHWKKHSKLFEICIECILQFPESEKIFLWTCCFLKTLLGKYTKLPVHTVIAIFRLKKETFRNYDDEKFISDFSTLTYSSLLYISVMSRCALNEEWRTYGIAELQGSLYLNRKMAVRVIKLVGNSIPNIKYEPALFYVLRIIKFFMIRTLLLAEDRPHVLPTLRMVENICAGEVRLAENPLWIQICSFFGCVDYVE